MHSTLLSILVRGKCILFEDDSNANVQCAAPCIIMRKSWLLMKR